MAAPFHGWESGSPRGVRSGVRLKRANGRGQTGALTHHFARTARRATGNSAVAGNAKYLAFNRRTFERGGEVRKEGSAERCKRRSAQPNDSRKLRCWGFMMQSSQPEAPVRRRGTGAYVPHGTTREGEEARTTTKSPTHRPTQPIFHHKRQTWTAIASCDNLPLLGRLFHLD